MSATLTLAPDALSTNASGSGAYAVLPPALCARPVRLKGRRWVVHNETGEIRERIDTRVLSSGVLHVPCKDRRAALCPRCAELYRRDAFGLIKTGLVGGAGFLPTHLDGHPLIFLTLTGPSFGLVHTIGKSGRCRPRRKADLCPHGTSLVCGRFHREDDPALGRPLCALCYRYRDHVVWNHNASELWRRTRIEIGREVDRLAKATGYRARISYAKVAEYQRRGLVHFHVVIRLDGFDPEYPAAVFPPTIAIGAEDLRRIALSAASTTLFRTAPHPDNPAGWVIAWGRQSEAHAIGDAESLDRAAGYLAKYTTKATESCGGLLHPVVCPACKGLPEVTGCQRCGGDGLGIDLDRAAVDDHVASLMFAAFEIGAAEDWYGLRRWAHMFGYGGHILTKSRHYSDTFRARRLRRQIWARQQAGNPTPPIALLGDDYTVIGGLEFAGTGWSPTTEADLAIASAARARDWPLSDDPDHIEPSLEEIH